MAEYEFLCETFFHLWHHESSESFAYSIEFDVALPNGKFLIMYCLFSFVFLIFIYLFFLTKNFQGNLAACFPWCSFTLEANTGVMECYNLYWHHVFYFYDLYCFDRWLFYLPLQQCPALSWSNVGEFTFFGQQREAQVPDRTHLLAVTSDNRRCPRTRPWRAPRQEHQIQTRCPSCYCSRTFRRPITLMGTCTPECSTLSLIVGNTKQL